MFGGKGGVGKTTCAAAAALYSAAHFPDRSYLLISTDPAHSLRDSLAGSPPLPNLEVVESDSQQSFMRFKEAHADRLSEIAARGTFFDDIDIEQLLSLSMPGLDEIMALITLSEFIENRTYSRVIVDTAPTGHTLRLLRLPRTMRSWLDALDAMMAKHRYMARLFSGRDPKDAADVFLEELAGSIERLVSLLRQAHLCSFVPVTIPESLSTHETIRLVGDLEGLGIRVTDMVVNRLRPAQDGCTTCRNLHDRHRAEMRVLRRTFAGHRLWEIPLQSTEVCGAERLSGFWETARPVGHAGESGRAAGGERRVRSRDAARAFLPAHPAGDTKGSLPGPVVETPARLPRAQTSLLVFAGKGGVGKTTLACATALRLAEEYPGRRILLFSADPAHSLSDCLGLHVGPEERRVKPGLTAMEIDAEAEFRRLKESYAEEVAGFFNSLAGGTTIDFEFDREVAERVLDLSPPGLDEVMALSRLSELLEAGSYDGIVLDTAPTGHLVRLLELPDVVQDWLRFLFSLFLKYRQVIRVPRMSGFMVAVSRRIKILRALLTDPAKAQLYAVSVLSEMAFQETRDLLGACKRIGLHAAGLFLNTATPPSECPLCNALRRAEGGMRRRFAEAFKGIPQSMVFHCGEPRGPERLLELGRSLFSSATSSGAEEEKQGRKPDRSRPTVRARGNRGRMVRAHWSAQTGGRHP